jgi:hypothetical protein
MIDRRFPPPWSAEVTPNCFIVRDANRQALSFKSRQSRATTMFLPQSSAVRIRESRISSEG